MNLSGQSKQFNIPETPWKLIAEQRNILRKLWNRDRDSFDLQYPVVCISWPYSFEVDGIKFGDNNQFNCFSKPELRVKNQEFDLACQLESVRHMRNLTGTIKKRKFYREKFRALFPPRAAEPLAEMMRTTAQDGPDLSTRVFFQAFPAHAGGSRW
ncbi:MAG: hypothetical protein PHP98_03085 [Kiritimatiellae bacterium]|jgi:hypothetical protein|nr:hypothetical protein [Kiritimatiellia bacterium]